MKRHKQKTLRNKTSIAEGNQEKDLPYKLAQDDAQTKNTQEKD
jgi:hypothetical protein